MVGSWVSYGTVAGWVSTWQGLGRQVMQWGMGIKMVGSWVSDDAVKEWMLMWQVSGHQLTKWGRWFCLLWHFYPGPSVWLEILLFVAFLLPVHSCSRWFHLSWPFYPWPTCMAGDSAIHSIFTVCSLVQQAVLLLMALLFLAHPCGWEFCYSQHSHCLFTCVAGGSTPVVLLSLAHLCGWGFCYLQHFYCLFACVASSSASRGTFIPGPSVWLGILLYVAFSLPLHLHGRWLHLLWHCYPWPIHMAGDSTICSIFTACSLMWQMVLPLVAFLSSTHSRGWRFCYLQQSHHLFVHVMDGSASHGILYLAHPCGWGIFLSSMLF